MRSAQTFAVAHFASSQVSSLRPFFHSLRALNSYVAMQRAHVQYVFLTVQVADEFSAVRRASAIGWSKGDVAGCDCRKQLGAAALRHLLDTP